MTSRLLVFGRLAHDSQSILAAIYRFALVRIELSLKIGTLELSIAPFADGDGRRSGFYNSQFALHGFQSSAFGVEAVDLWKSNGTSTDRFRSETGR
jgi:hypothetical protein